jgi:uroporphyrinogen-III synthase
VIRPGRPLSLGDAQAILVTSANAVPALPRTARPVLAVGDATAEAARACGCADVRSAGGDAVDLTRLATATLDPAAGPLLLASGARQGMPLATALRVAGFRVRRRVAYAARPIRDLPGPARAALTAGQVRWALFFSADTARAFRAALARAGLEAAVAGIEALAIGRPAADALAGLPWRLIRVAPAPTQDALLDMLPR